jgi:hypothetical protein
MSTILAAGVTTPTALNITTDTSGQMVLATNGSTPALTLSTAQNAAFANNVSVAGTTTLTGAATASSTLAVTGAITASSTLAVTSTSTFTGAITATGGIISGAAAAPTFSANVTGSATQTFINNNWTKAQFPNTEWDTNSNYDNTTNYRFTPTVSGYYQLNACVSLNGSFATEIAVAIYKNGTKYKVGTDLSNGSVAFGYGQTVNVLVQMNGSTDYVEVYLYQSSGANRNNLTDPALFYFQGIFVRSL